MPHKLAFKVTHASGQDDVCRASELNYHSPLTKGWQAARYMYSIQLFHACLVKSQNYATRCRGQLNALLPEAARPRAIVH